MNIDKFNLKIMKNKIEIIKVQLIIKVITERTKNNWKYKIMHFVENINIELSRKPHEAESS